VSPLLALLCPLEELPLSPLPLLPPPSSALAELSELLSDLLSDVLLSDLLSDFPTTRGRSTPVFCRNVMSSLVAVAAACWFLPELGAAPVRCMTIAATAMTVPTAIACRRRRLATSGQKSADFSMRVHAPRKVR
jgi:hypothetical protein